MTKGLGLIKGKVKSKFIQKNYYLILVDPVVLNNKMNYLKSFLINKNFTLFTLMLEPADINYCGTKIFMVTNIFALQLFKNIIGTQFHPEKSKAVLTF